MRTCAFILILTFVFVLTGSVQSAEKSVVVGFKHKPGDSERALIWAARGDIRHNYQLIPAVAASLPEEEIEELKKNSKVAYVEESAIYTATVAPQLPADEYEYSWGTRHIRADFAHASGNKGAGVRIAILDTGIDYNHEDLAGNYRGGHDFVFNDDDPFDDSFNSHGTHIAGIIAAEENGFGMIGVAPEADLFAVKVLDGAGFGTEEWIIAGIDWAVANGVDVINMSIEGPDRQGLREACDRARDAGVVLVAAGGNSLVGEGPIEFPAAYESVIAVTGTDPSDLPGYFAPIGESLELAAPGVDVVSTVSGGGYGSLSGTSQAAAYVTGTAALLVLAGVDDLNGDELVNNEDVRLTLLLTASDLGTAGNDATYGHGLVNAEAASFTGISRDVVISDATALEGTVTINGRGFGGYVAGSITSVTAPITTGNGNRKTTTYVKGTIISWSDTTIVAEFDSGPNEVTVQSVFGTDTSEVGGGNSWALRIPLVDASEMQVTFSPFGSYLLVDERINDQAIIGIGVEYANGVIFWFDAVGTVFFGITDHDAATMQGVVFNFRGANSFWFARQ